MNLGPEIKRVRTEHALSQEFLCGNSDFPITKSTLIRWEAGRAPRIPVQALQAFAKLHDLSLGEYLKELGVDLGLKPEIKTPQLVVIANPEQATELVRQGQGLYVAIPVIRDKAGMRASQDTYDENDIEGYAVIFQSWIVGSPKRYFCIRLENDSMQPILPKGSIVCVDKAQNDAAYVLIERRLVAFVQNNKVRVSRLTSVVTDYGIIIHDMRASRSEHILGDGVVVGAVVWAWSKLDAVKPFGI